MGQHDALGEPLADVTSGDATTIAVVRTPPTHFHPDANAATLLGVGGPLRGFAAAAPHTL
jgi:hypothetical protein